MNPPHRNLPAWAAWLAQDADGAWWCYEAEPNQHDIGWYEYEVGRIEKLGQGEPNPAWQESLVKVPDWQQADPGAIARQSEPGQDVDCRS